MANAGPNTNGSQCKYPTYRTTISHSTTTTTNEPNFRRRMNNSSNSSSSSSHRGGLLEEDSSTSTWKIQDIHACLSHGLTCLFPSFVLSSLDIIYDDTTTTTTWLLHDPACIVFICTGATPWLNGKHTVFGKVTNGLDLVKQMESYGTEMGKPRAVSS